MGLMTVLKFNSEHEPAGSPKGGQFAKKPSGPTWRDPKPDWTQAMRDEYEQVKSLDFNSPEYQAFYAKTQALRVLEQQWDTSMLKALDRGDITLEEARAKGFYPMWGESNFGTLPPELYHVTTATDAVIAEGLKSRAELGQHSGLGLGGGDDKNISFTADPAVGESILAGMLLAHDVFSGEISMEQLVEFARTGHEGSTPFLEVMQNSMGGYSERYPGSDLTLQLWDVIHDTETLKMRTGVTPEDPTFWIGSMGSKKQQDRMLHELKQVDSGTDEYNLWQMPASPSDAAHRKEAFFKRWMAYREMNGGPMDPLFFGSDLQKLGQTPKEQIHLLKYLTKPGAHGHQLSALGEWRTHTNEKLLFSQILKEHRIRKLNPYHEPAGSSIGGRFAKKPGAKEWTLDQIYDEELRRRDYVGEALNTPEGMALVAAERAAEKALDNRHKQLLEEVKTKLRENIKLLPDASLADTLAAAESLDFMASVRVWDKFPTDDEALRLQQLLDSAANKRRIFVEAYIQDNSPPLPEYSDSARQEREKFTSTPEFKAWFGDSKVVDKNGTPLVAFHGSDKDIEVFITDRDMGETDRLKSNPNYTGELGSFFGAPSLYSANYDTGNAEYTAEVFSEYRNDNSDQPSGDVVYPVFLSIKKPMEYEGFDDLRDDRDDTGGSRELRARLIAEGYDGLVIRNSMTDGDMDRDDWVAFYPEQIKSAMGNTGAFDPKDKRITKFSRALKFNANHEPAGSPKGGQFARTPWKGRHAPDKTNIDRLLSEMPREVTELPELVTVYHGTTSRYLTNILRHGIRFNTRNPRGDLAMYGSQAHREKGKKLKPRGVFITPSIFSAELYATLTTRDLNMGLGLFFGRHSDDPKKLKKVVLTRRCQDGEVVLHRGGQS
jgi:hypothetical protein